MFSFKDFLLNEGSSDFKKLQKNKVPLTDDERALVFKRKAVWHNHPNPKVKKVPAVWKSVDKNGKVTFITNTHRLYKTAPTLKGAINKYHSTIKGTA